MTANWHFPKVIPAELRNLPPEEAAALVGHNPPAPIPRPPTFHTFPDPGLVAALRPHLTNITVAVDPAMSNGNDEAGIVAAAALSRDFDVTIHIPGNGFRLQRRAIVLDDASMEPDGPSSWANRAVATAIAWGASTIAVEKNQGGDLNVTVLEQAIAADPQAAAMKQQGQLSVVKVHSYEGKVLRAEPVSHLYDQRRVLHLRRFPWLEQQMTEWLPDSRTSPDRLDALVHALAHLVPILEMGHATIHGHSGAGAARPAAVPEAPESVPEFGADGTHDGAHDGPPAESPARSLPSTDSPPTTILDPVSATQAPAPRRSGLPHLNSSTLPARQNSPRRGLYSRSISSQTRRWTPS